MEKSIQVEIQGIRKDSIDKTNNLIAIVYANNVFKYVHIDRIVGGNNTITTTPAGSKDLDSFTINIRAIYSAVSVGPIENVASDEIKQFEEALFNVIKDIDKNSKNFKFTYTNTEYTPTISSTTSSNY